MTILKNHFFSSLCDENVLKNTSNDIYPSTQVNDNIENPAVFKYLIDNVVR